MASSSSPELTPRATQEHKRELAHQLDTMRQDLDLSPQHLYEALDFRQTLRRQASEHLYPLMGGGFLLGFFLARLAKPPSRQTQSTQATIATAGKTSLLLNGLLAIGKPLLRSWITDQIQARYHRHTPSHPRQIPPL